MTASATVTHPDAGPTTAAAKAFVAEHRPAAEALGRTIAALVDDPATLHDALRDGLATLADPAYRDGQAFVAPGIGATIGVRNPLLDAVGRTFRSETRGVGPARLLFVADRLLRSDRLEVRWFAFPLLGRILPDDPERAWQLIRRAARDAADWITVDTLAGPAAGGILLEPYRWAELEQLVFSPNPWERRLVGSTVASMPFVDRRAGRSQDVFRHGLSLVEDLIGDAEPNVQKSLAWALRSMAAIDAGAVAAFCEREAARAAASDDGHRAWVIRDALSKIDPDRAGVIRGRLAGIRRRPGAASTSTAAATAERFAAGLPPASDLPEPPLT